MKQLMKPLNREDFRKALAHGLGRAMLHIQHLGLDDVLDLVVEACIHNQAYDPQCEGSRADWLFPIFKDSKYYTLFQDAILKALSNEAHTWDADQLCKLAKLMAENGDDQAREALKKRATEIASLNAGEDLMSSDWVGVTEWIEVGGEEAFLDLARIYGQHLQKDPGDRVVDLFNHVCDEKKSGYKELLQKYGKDDPAIHLYCDFVEGKGVFSISDTEGHEQEQERRERTYREDTISQVIDDARSGLGQYPVRYRKFGQKASQDELEAIFEHLINESNPECQLRLLWVFQEVPVPYLHPKLIEWAHDVSGDDLRSAAISALAQLTDQKVHELAREKVNAYPCEVPQVLELFIKNFDAADASLIEQALESVRADVNQLHDLGSRVIDIAEKQKDVALVDALNWCYENNPCEICRLSAVEFLYDLGKLDEAIRFECFYDSYKEVRKFAKALNEV